MSLCFLLEILVTELQGSMRQCKAFLHRRIIFSQTAHHAAVLEGQTVGIFEIDRLGPSVIDDVRNLNAFGNQCVALLDQARLTAGFESEVIGSDRKRPVRPVRD